MIEKLHLKREIMLFQRLFEQFLLDLRIFCIEDEILIRINTHTRGTCPCYSILSSIRFGVLTESIERVSY